jgi:hypothetical protein
MAWTDSRIFRAYITDQLNLATTTKIKLDGTDTLKNALYVTGATPDRNVTRANTAYAVDQWVVGNEVSQAVQWPVGGIALTGQSLNSATANTVFFTASNTVSGSSFTTTAAVFGSLIYDTTATTATNQGICYLYFGGGNSVTLGTLTISYAASPAGVFNITV